MLEKKKKKKKKQISFADLKVYVAQPSVWNLEFVVIENNTQIRSYFFCYCYYCLFIYFFVIVHEHFLKKMCEFVL